MKQSIPLMEHDVFLCYSARDQGVADAVCRRLETDGMRCWLAMRDITPGQNWGGAIVEAIGRSRVFVIIFSAEANRSQQVLREVERAVNRRTPIIPFRIEKIAPTRDLEYYLSTTHWLDALTPPLDSHVARLSASIRRQLDLSPRQPGSRLEAEPAPARTGIAVDLLKENYLDIGSTKPRATTTPAAPKSNRRRRRLRRWLVVPATVALTVAALGVTALVGPRVWDGRSPEPEREAPHPRTVAVLPFVNLSRDAADDYFSDGITEEIVNKLSKVQGLKVAASSSSFSYKGRHEDVRLVGTALGVAMVLEGSVRKAGNRVRVSAQLINVQDGYRVWSQEFDRSANDIFAVQDEIANAIAQAFELHFVSADETHPPNASGNAEAYDLYLRGRHLITPYVQERNDSAISYFQQALQKDPNFALAYAGLARAYIAGGEFVVPKQILPKAKEAALHALQLDSSLVETRMVLADVHQVYDRDWAAAERELQRAIALNPNAPHPHGAYADLLLDSRRFKEAKVERQRFWDLLRANAPDTLLPSFRVDQQISWGSYNLYAGRKRDALRHTRAALELDPSNMTARWLLSIVYLRSGRPKDAVVGLEKLADETRRALPMYSHLGAAYAEAGRLSEARAVLDTLHRRASERYIPKDQIALIHFALGEKTEAIQWLQRAIDDYHWWMPNANAHPLFAPYHDDPRFLELMRQIGAPSP